MGFIKQIKNKAYYKRFQVARKRRRQGKTDYQARIKLVKQDKNKYNAPRYRLVVRHTNRKVVCQIAYATLSGDKILAQALSTELPRYGIKAGLSNYAATYATGLLVARRLLKTLKMDEATFEGVTECDGEEFHIEEELEDDDRRPFKALLDIGLVRTTVGAKVFAAMKGAADGGLHVPHNCKRFPGYEAGEKGQEGNFEAEALKARIMGEHVAEYMSSMQEEDEEKYNSHFASYIKAGIDADSIEDMYANAHKAIRADPSFTKKEANKVTITRKGNKISDGAKTYNRDKKKSKAEKFGRVAQKIANARKRMLAAVEDDDEEEE